MAFALSAFDEAVGLFCDDNPSDDACDDAAWTVTARETELDKATVVEGEITMSGECVDEGVSARACAPCVGAGYEDAEVGGENVEADDCRVGGVDVAASDDGDDGEGVRTSSVAVSDSGSGGRGKDDSSGIGECAEEGAQCRTRKRRSRAWRFDARLIATLGALAPNTHELTIGFVDVDDAGGFFRRVWVSEGGACAPGACVASPCHGGACAHTHPYGNRPSSADMVKAIVDRKRDVSFVLAPLGVFAYAATFEGRNVWNGLSHVDARRLRATWKLLGFFMQEETQAGDVKRYLRLMTDAGFVATYASYADLAGYRYLRFNAGDESAGKTRV